MENLLWSQRAWVLRHDPLAMRGYMSSRIFCKSVFLLTFSTRDGIKRAQGLGLLEDVLTLRLAPGTGDIQ